MAIVGTVLLLGFGFDAHGPIRREVAECLRECRGRGIRFVDALVVSRDQRGVLSFEADDSSAGVGPDSPGRVVRQLLTGVEGDTTPSEPLELHSSRVFGLDLEAVESLAYRIDIDTSALFVLVETRWATELLVEVLESGGFPIVMGCLEPETMLVIGPQVAQAAAARERRDGIASAAGSSMLDALATAAQPSRPVVSDVIRTLVGARIIEASDVAQAVSALADAGLVSRATIEHALSASDDRDSER